MQSSTPIDPSKTAQVCGSVADLSRSAVDWLAQPANRARAGQEYDSKVRALRRNARTAERLKLAATSPPSMAVYGASQAGKSYLVAHLAAPPVGSGAVGQAEQSAVVLPHYNGGIKFLDINPIGGRESTGLVTRFTKQRINVDAEFPVLIKLLTAADLVKILTSCFAVDMEQTGEQAMDEQALTQLLADVARLPRSTANGLDADDVFEIKDLCTQRYGHLEIFSRLAACDYFDTAAPLAAGLSVDGLARLFEPLWNCVPRFSLLFRKLHGALAELGFAATVQCGMDALLPRTDEATRRAMTIIDVDTLKRLLQPLDEKISVRHRSGTARLDRPLVAALAAELVLNLGGQTRPFLDDIDLLDFPGARSRGEITRAKLDEPSSTEDVFLRGKVALLFDRYREEYDLTSMLLCVGPSTQEVVSLRTLVNGWVEATHGKTPERRRDFGTTTLMLVLTKFDTQFERKAGDETSSSDRWKARLDASITNFLGRTGDWTKAWTPGRPFNNVFWYRNPFFEQPHLFDLQKTSGGMREIGLREAIRPDIDDMRKAYLDLDLVKQHLADPLAAWDAAMTLNDGGITYLAEHIARIGRANVKLRQVVQKITEIAQETDRSLRPLYYDTDPLAQRAARQRDAEKIAQELAAAGGDLLFGRFLARLTVSAEELERIFRSVRLREGSSTSKVVTPPTSGANKLWDRIANRGKPGGTSTQPGSATAATPTELLPAIDCSDPSGAGLDLAGRFACRSYAFWSERVHEACRAPDILEFFRLSADGAQTLATELIAGSRRLRVVDQLAAKTRPSTLHHGASQDLGAATPALLAANIINDYVAYIGRNGLVVDRDVTADPNDPRFARQSNRNEPRLGAERAVSAHTYCVDWVSSFLDLVGANAASATGVNFDLAQNDRLGALLGSLKALELDEVTTR